MDWSDPAARGAVMERVGIDEYNRLHEEQRERETVAIVNGYRIRLIPTRFGMLHTVDSRTHLYPKFDDAKADAESAPPGPHHEDRRASSA